MQPEGKLENKASRSVIKHDHVQGHAHAVPQRDANASTHACMIVHAVNRRFAITGTDACARGVFALGSHKQ
ncbi:hypothetical protein PF003_g966 [Phytophthora fragariae]|nr:hypothetical protein PF003_g966 [Phytophthora fragariae]